MDLLKERSEKGLLLSTWSFSCSLSLHDLLAVLILDDAHKPAGAHASEAT